MDNMRDRKRYKLYCAVGYPPSKARDYLDLLLRYQNLTAEDRLRFENMYKLEFNEDYKYPDGWADDYPDDKVTQIQVTVDLKERDDKIERLEAEITQANDRIKELEGGLKKWIGHDGWHHPRCGIGYLPAKCNCGFELLKGK